MRVLLVDDHPLFISGLQNLLHAAGIEVVGTARDGAGAVLAAKNLKPDVILMDIQMPECDGITATRQIKADFPEIKVVMLTMTDEDNLLFEAIKSGASGFLLKNIEASEFLELLTGLAEGQTIFSPGLANRLVREFVIGKEQKPAVAPPDPPTTQQRLTPRQEEVLVQIARGLSYKEVAATLYISEATVKYHMREILERLHLENRIQAIAYAVQARKPENG